MQLSDLGVLGLGGAMIALLIYLIASGVPNRRQQQWRKSDDGGGGGAFDARHYRMDLRHRRFKVRPESVYIDTLEVKSNEFIRPLTPITITCVNCLLGVLALLATLSVLQNSKLMGCVFTQPIRSSFEAQGTTLQRAAGVESATEQLLSQFGDLDPQDCGKWHNCSPTSDMLFNWENVVIKSIFG